MSVMRIFTRGRFPRNLPRGTTAIAAWIVAAATTLLSMLYAPMVPAVVLTVGLAIAATVMFARRISEASTQAAFMAGVMHERATNDSAQLPMASGGTIARVVHLPDQRARRAKPSPRHRS